MSYSIQANIVPTIVTITNSSQEEKAIQLYRTQITVLQKPKDVLKLKVDNSSELIYFLSLGDGFDIETEIIEPENPVDPVDPELPEGILPLQVGAVVNKLYFDTSKDMLDIPLALETIIFDVGVSNSRVEIGNTFDLSTINLAQAGETVLFEIAYLDVRTKQIMEGGAKVIFDNDSKSLFIRDNLTSNFQYLFSGQQWNRNFFDTTTLGLSPTIKFLCVAAPIYSIPEFSGLSFSFKKGISMITFNTINQYFTMELVSSVSTYKYIGLTSGAGNSSFVYMTLFGGWCGWVREPGVYKTDEIGSYLDLTSIPEEQRTIASISSNESVQMNLILGYA